MKRVDLAYGGFFQGIRKLPKFKSIRDYSGWCYPAKSGWKINSNGKHGSLLLNDLGITIDVPTPECKFGSNSDLKYESIIAFDLGTETALTLYDGSDFTELENPRFTKKAESQIKQKSKALLGVRAPNRTKKIQASRRMYSYNLSVIRIGVTSK
ncbi:hypothetical protein [Floridanema aerugineum]|uniref:Transposase n=1 Tax=Floridaenema aerugineum BLCC-F46 TaxID=3153654 RepID=A0ABV4X998_9CYAN